jgi:hypothetical protein
MKFLPLTICLFSVVLFGACSGNTATTNGNGLTAAISGNGNTDAEASWSCKVDGKDISGKGSDLYINVGTVHAPGILYFTLSTNHTGDLAKDLRVGGFGFEVPDHGTTVIRGVENPDFSIAYSTANDPNSTYACKEITLTISTSATRVKGTFSGTIIEPKTSREVPVTEGKFDIPLFPLSKK